MADPSWRFGDLCPLPAARPGPPPLTTRRDFLRLTAAGGAALFIPTLFTACNEMPTNPAAAAVIDTRTEAGLLNALYALKQLNGDFFARVTAQRFIGMTAAELTLFGDMLGQAGSHVAYFIEVLHQRRVYDLLEFDFSGVDFDNRAAVMALAQQLTDTSAAAYLGALPRLTTADTRLVIAKIASVEARHSATVRDLIDAHPAFARTGTAFAAPAVVNPADGRGVAQSPAEALSAVRSYFRTSLTVWG